MSNRINLGQVIGATGATGAQGLTGASGQDGITPHIENGYWYIGTTNQNVKAKGDSWLTGTGAPTTQGVNGDYYLDTATENVYYKTNNVWGLLTNIKGEQGQQGLQGENATSIEIGTITTLDSGEPATATLTPLGNGVYELNLGIPEGEQGERGEQGLAGNTTAYVGGFAVNTLNFNSEPQAQIDSKLNNNLGAENSGKMLVVGADGSVTTTSRDAENDVVDVYIVGETDYADDWFSLTAGGEPITPLQGRIYIVKTSGDFYLLQYVWNGTAYEQTGGGDTSGLATKTQAVGSVLLTIDSSTYVITLQAKDVNGTNIGTAQTIDLPLESVVVNGSYNSLTEKLTLTLQNGNTIEIDISSIVSGLQNEITSQNKLSADLVDDTSTTNKFVSASDKTAWNNNTTAISGILDGTDIDSFADVESALADKQDVIDSTSKLDADLIDDTSSTNKLVTSTEKTEWSGNTTAISGILNGQSLDSFADVETALNLKEDTISATHKILSDFVDDSGATNLFVTSADKSNWNGKAEVPTIFSNVSATSWEADNTYQDYGYKCELGLNGVTSSDFAEVVFGVAEATSGNYAPVALTGTDTVTIYSKVNDSITIPTIKVDSL